jgi:hypothetical protein
LARTLSEVHNIWENAKLGDAKRRFFETRMKFQLVDIIQIPAENRDRFLHCCMETVPNTEVIG